MWPIHLRPLQDESLSSWLTRMSLAYGVKACTFGSKFLGTHQFLQGDIDRQVRRRILTSLSQESGISYSCLSSTVMRYAYRNAFDNYTPNNRIPDILGVGLRSRRYTKYGQQYCPLCLKEDSDPYMRLHWRLTLMPMCIKHGVILHDACPHCGNPVNQLHVDVILTNQKYCARCWNSLCAVTAYKGGSESVAKLCSAVFYGMRSGWVEHENIGKLMTPVFTKGIFRIVQIIYSKRFCKHAWAHAERMFGIRGNINVSNSYYALSGERVETRYAVVFVISQLLKDWPANWLRYCELAGITMSKVTPYNECIPLWVQNTLVKELNKTNYRITDNELKSVLEYMKNHDMRISLSAVASLLGKDLSMKLNKEKQAIYAQYFVNC